MKLRRNRQAGRSGRVRNQPRRRLRLPEAETAAAQPRLPYERNTGRDVSREQIIEHGRRVGSFWLQRFGLLILIIVATVAIIYGVLVTPNAKITTISQAASSPVLLRDTATYQAAIDSLLAASPENRTKLTINSAAISQQFTSQFPEVAHASLVLPLAAHRPILYIEPARPAVVLVAHNGSYVLDATGKVLIASTQLPSNAKLELPVITDQSNLQARVGSQALPSQTVQTIEAVIAQLATRNVTLSSLTLPPSSSELDATVSDAPYRAKFNLQTGTGRQQAGTFLATQAELKRQNVTPTQYIDVRVDGRAYYQ